MRRRQPRRKELRLQLIERWRAAAARQEKLMLGAFGKVVDTEITRRLALLEAGEPVLLSDWELPADLLAGHPPATRGGKAFYRLDPDGSLTPMPK
jgi:hypothetical protein